MFCFFCFVLSLLCTKALNHPFSPKRKGVFLNSVTSLLLGLEGEYDLCPLRLAFHTLEVRLLTCVAASHAGRNTQIRTDFINTVPIRVKECD